MIMVLTLDRSFLVDADLFVFLVFLKDSERKILIIN